MTLIQMLLSGIPGGRVNAYCRMTYRHSVFRATGGDGGPHAYPRMAAECLRQQFISPEEKKRTMKTTLTRLWTEDEGQDLIEYGLLLALITLLSIASIKTIGTTVATIFNNAVNNLQTNTQ